MEPINPARPGPWQTGSATVLRQNSDGEGWMGHPASALAGGMKASAEPGGFYIAIFSHSAWAFLVDVSIM